MDPHLLHVGLDLVISKPLDLDPDFNASNGEIEQFQKLEWNSEGGWVWKNPE